jgi:hypothetical protein
MPSVLGETCLQILLWITEPVGYYKLSEMLMSRSHNNEVCSIAVDVPVIRFIIN